MHRQSYILRDMYHRLPTLALGPFPYRDFHEGVRESGDAECQVGRRLWIRKLDFIVEQDMGKKHLDDDRDIESRRTSAINH